MDHADANAAEAGQGLAFFLGLVFVTFASAATVVAIILFFAVSIKSAAIALIIAVLPAVIAGILFYQARDRT